MKKVPPQNAIQEALRFPNGYVYEIDERYKNMLEVPATAIKGAWKVNQQGLIEGDFIENPNYNNTE